MKSSILILNGGSSSIRFAIYSADSLSRHLDGKVERMGTAAATLLVNEPDSKPFLLAARHHPVEAFLDWLEAHPLFPAVTAVGHRVVHGMKHSQPIRVKPKLIAELRRMIPYDPEHLPLEIGLIEALLKRHPKLSQVACFDTAFHRGMPDVAKRLPIPRRYARKGIERYGFHGLSYSYLMEELRRIAPREAKGRVIIAHLGGGASLAAIRDGQSIDTSMGFTPTAGLMMGTRSGDLDPGLSYYLSRTENLTPKQFQHMVNHESGLLGVSGRSSDLRDLFAHESTDTRAAEAIEMFCYTARKWIGAYSAALGGLDTLVFSAGIGENSPAIRQRICHGLDFLGVKIDARRNQRHAPVISRETSRVTVRVIPTDEQLMIARTVRRVLAPGSMKDK